MTSSTTDYVILGDEPEIFALALCTRGKPNEAYCVALPDDPFTTTIARKEILTILYGSGVSFMKVSELSQAGFLEAQRQFYIIVRSCTSHFLSRTILGDIRDLCQSGAGVQLKVIVLQSGIVSPIERALESSGFTLVTFHNQKFLSEYPHFPTDLALQLKCDQWDLSVLEFRRHPDRILTRSANNQPMTTSPPPPPTTMSITKSVSPPQDGELFTLVSFSHNVPDVEPSSMMEDPPSTTQKSNNNNETPSPYANYGSFSPSSSPGRANRNGMVQSPRRRQVTTVYIRDDDVDIDYRGKRGIILSSQFHEATNEVLYEIALFGEGGNSLERRFTSKELMFEEVEYSRHTKKS